MASERHLKIHRLDLRFKLSNVYKLKMLLVLLKTVIIFNWMVLGTGYTTPYADL